MRPSVRDQYMLSRLSGEQKPPHILSGLLAITGSTACPVKVISNKSDLIHYPSSSERYIEGVIGLIVHGLGTEAIRSLARPEKCFMSLPVHRDE